jgi:DNA repair protein RadA/Sms
VPRARVVRVATGLSDWDEALSGGLVRGATLLLGGEPGTGKTSGALRTLNRAGGLYVSAEMSSASLRIYAERLRLTASRVSVLETARMRDVVHVVERVRPRVVVVDSLPKMTVEGARRGAAAEELDAARALSALARRTNVAAVAIVHATKAGEPAGLEALVHEADGLLWLTRTRVSTQKKWRFGAPRSVRRPRATLLRDR